MAKVVADMTMSLDGYVAGPNDGKDNPLGDGGMRLHDWFFSGSAPSSFDDFFRPADDSREVLEEMFTTTGAFVTGRRTYDIVDGWGGSHPLRVPIFVVTHHAPEHPPSAKSTTFVTDGVERAIALAKEAAGEKDVLVGTPSIIDQALKAGLIDELRIHLAPVLLGGGLRLFGNLGPAQIELERTRIVDAQGMTHFSFQVMK